MIKYLPFLVAVFVLSACGSNPYKSDPKQSEALNAARAGGIASLQLKDVPREKIEQALKREGLDPDTEAAIGLGFASAKYAGLMAATPGISNLLGGSLFALRAIFTRDYQPHLNTGFFAWMPLEMAKDEEDAQAQMKQILEAAFIKALDDVNEVRIVSRWYNPTLASPYKKRQVIVESDYCQFDEPHYECEYRSRIDEPEKALSPDFLGTRMSYRWLMMKDAPLMFFHVARQVANTEYDPESGRTYYKIPRGKGGTPYYRSHEFYIKLTKYLPEWVYAYLRPTKSRPYPVVVNRGRTLYFIEPADPNASIVKASADQGSDHE